MSLRRVVLASGNPGKLAEIRRLLQGLPIELVSQAELDLPPAPETACTFVENALAKARAASQASGLAAIADDSGLEVDALGGEPGVHSARYASRHGDDRANNEKLLQALQGVPEASRQARFRCVAVFLFHAEHPVPIIAQGTWEGDIATAPRGEAGFGYDPLFHLPARGVTAAELTAEEKNRLSHRAQAFLRLRECLQDALDNR
jgi:XTP/dITP diphosphohydrolase